MSQVIQRRYSEMIYKTKVKIIKLKDKLDAEEILLRDLESELKTLKK